MSRVADILDFFYDQTKAALPDHQELLDTEDLNNNPEGITKQGYGITVASGEHPERDLCNNAYWYRRYFDVLITREVVSLYSDSATRKAAMKQILDDLHAVLNKWAGVNDLVTSTGQQKAFAFVVRKDPGPKPMIIGGKQHLYIEVTISAEYREPKT